VSATDDIPGLVIESLLVLGIAYVFLRHAYRMYVGTEARLRSLLGWSVLYAVLGSTTIASTLVPFPTAEEATLLFIGLVDTACAVLAGVWTYRSVERYAAFEWRPPRALFYRMRPFVPVLYAVLFMFEIAVELATLGVNVPSEAPSPDTLAAVWEVVLRVSDLCLSIAAGIIIGASAAVYSELHRRRAAADASTVADAVD
jgi:hypothetical protein